MASLNEVDRLCLEAWIGKRKSFSLVYKASRDGCDAAIFHTNCNNKGPTVTVLYNKDKSVYGGYTSVSWTSSQKYVSDKNAFLFRLYHNGLLKPVQFPAKEVDGCQGCGNASYNCHSYGTKYNFGNGMSSCSHCGSNAYRCSNCGGQYSFNPNVKFACCIYDDSASGPAFGNASGYDLQTFTGTVNKFGDSFTLNGKCQFGTAFDVKGETANTINNNKLDVIELEVYTLSDLSDDEIKKRTQVSLGMSSRKDKPWKKFPGWNAKVLEQLTEYVENYKPYKRLDVAEARILMIGPVGAGKSSFLNTITSVFRRRISNKAASGSVMKSLTTALRLYQIEDTGCNGYMNFRICDTMGLEEEHGLENEELGYLLDGHIPDRYQFNPSVPFNRDVPGFVQYPELHQKIHCVVFVVDASIADVMSEKVLERIKMLQKVTYHRDISQVVLMTKIDKVCPAVADNIATTFQSMAVKEAVDKVSQTMGIPRSNVLPVKNYEMEGELEDNINILALYSLKQILNFADDYLSNVYEKMEAQQQTERIDRYGSEKLRKSAMKE